MMNKVIAYTSTIDKVLQEVMFWGFMMTNEVFVYTRNI